MISVRVKLFAIYQEVLGQEELRLQLDPGTTVEQVCAQLIAQYPQLSAWQSQTRFGVNQEFVPPATPLADQDEVVFIPPVSGG